MLKILKPIFVMAILAVSGYSQAGDILLRENILITSVNCNYTTVIFQDGSTPGQSLGIDKSPEPGVQDYASFCKKLKSYEGTGEPVQLLVKWLGWEPKGQVYLQQIVGFIDQQMSQEKNPINAVVKVSNYTKFKKTLCGSQACILQSKPITSRYYVRTADQLLVSYSPAKKSVSASKVETYHFNNDTATLNVDMSGDNSDYRVYPAILSNGASIPFSMH